MGAEQHCWTILSLCHLVEFRWQLVDCWLASIMSHDMLSSGVKEKRLDMQIWPFRIDCEGCFPFRVKYLCDENHVFYWRKLPLISVALLESFDVDTCKINEWFILVISNMINLLVKAHFLLKRLQFSAFEIAAKCTGWGRVWSKKSYLLSARVYKLLVIILSFQLFLKSYQIFIAYLIGV